MALKGDHVNWQAVLVLRNLSHLYFKSQFKNLSQNPLVKKHNGSNWMRNPILKRCVYFKEDFKILKYFSYLLPGQTIENNIKM